MACLQMYRELLLLATFLRVHSNSKEVSYFSSENTVFTRKNVYSRKSTSLELASVHSFLWKPFLLEEAIVFIDFVVSKYQLIGINGYLYTPCADQVY